MKRFISLLLAAVLCLSFSVSLGAVSDGRSEFKSTLQMGDWVPAMDTEEQVKTMAENGIDFTFVWYYDSNSEKSRNQVEWCGKYGIKCILKDVHLEVYGGNSAEKISALTEAEIYEIIKPNIDNPTVVGYNIWDEPMPGQNLTDIGNIVAKFRKVAGDLIPFVNLYPPISSFDYESYLNEYFDKTGLDYVSFDIYPLLGETQTDYIKAVSTAARVAQERGADFWIFIQSMSYEGHRTPRNVNDLWFQSYIALSFGATKLMHFCYKNPFKDEFTASISVDGNTKTEVWDLTNRLNNDMEFLSTVLKKHNYIGTFLTESEQTNTPEYLWKYNYPYQYPAYRTIRQLNSDMPVLTGVFDNAFTLVNVSEPINNTSAVISLDLRAVKNVKITRQGKTDEWLPDPDGKYKITLESGEGVFVEYEDSRTEEQKLFDSYLEEYRKVALNLAKTNKNIYVEETYTALKNALSDVEEAANSDDFSSEQLLPLIETMREANKKLLTNKMLYKGLSEKLFEKYSALSQPLFSAESYAAFKANYDELKSLYDKDLSDTFANNRKLETAYKNALSGCNDLSFSGLYGDIDFNGAVTLTDAMKAFMYVAGKGVLDINSLYAADYSGSAQPDIADAMNIFLTVAGKR